MSGSHLTLKSVLPAGRLGSMQESPPNDPAEARIMSPFSDAESAHVPRRRKSAPLLWAVVGLVFLVLLSVGTFSVFRYLNDPLRTLEPFPVSKYLDGYKSLAGAKFRGNLRVENDLGWKGGVGRLMVFSFQDEPRPIVVMIPPDLAQIYFTKGQTYESELEVKEGGLIYANSIRKN
jgi:hypothetical protein